MVIPEGYKQTEIGVIPEDWECLPLLSKCNLLNGLTYTPNNIVSNGLLVLRSSNIQNNRLSFIDNVYVDLKVDDEKLIQKDDIIICVRNGSAALIGKCAQASRAYPVTFGAFMAVLRGKSNNYIFQLLQQGTIQRHISKNSGATINQITNGDFKEIFVPFPLQCEEQDSIAEALSDVDSMLTSLEKLIEKKKAIKQGAMQKLLTGKKRLPGFSGEWDTYKFGNLCTICRGGSPRPIQDFLTTNDEGINWIKIGDVKSNAKYITSTQEKIIESGIAMSRRVYKGDFILSNSMSFGRPYILKIDGCIHDGWLAIQDYKDCFNTDFLYYLLSSEYVFNQYVQMAAGSSVQNLNKDKVAQLDIFLPSVTEQTAIASILSDMDSEIEALEQKLAKTRQLKQGMMQQLLTGKIRLV